jgi:hypothetical protein
MATLPYTSANQSFKLLTDSNVLHKPNKLDRILKPSSVDPIVFIASLNGQ